MKILAMYLPQYHAIPENDKWWGKGYTEWTAVKNAKALYKGHNEPRIPLNNNYYDLSDETAETWEWQAVLARKYGIYGFCIYHYWFEGKQLLEKPMEILLSHPEIDINYCICWANETWSRNWYEQERTILQEQTYGKEEAWINHYTYLKKFFKDERYIKIDNKPVINIYRSWEIQDLSEMKTLWNALAKQDGWSGVYVVAGISGKGEEKRLDVIDAQYIFEPGNTLKKCLNTFEYTSYIVKTGVKRICNKIFKTQFLEHIVDARMIYRHIENNEIPLNAFPGTFPQWDNTPRTGTSGLSYIHTSPDKFKKHLKKLKLKYEQKEFLYINAWNEWGEGAYLEPDENNRYAFLDAIKEVFQEEIQFL